MHNPATSWGISSSIAAMTCRRWFNWWWLLPHQSTWNHKKHEKIHVKANIVFQTSSFGGSILGFRSCKWWEIEGWFNHLYVYEEFKLTFIQSCWEIWQLDFKGIPTRGCLTSKILRTGENPKSFFAKNHGEGKLEPVSLSNCCSGEKNSIHLHKSLVFSRSLR